MIALVTLVALALQEPPPRSPDGGERRGRESVPQDPAARDRAIRDLEKRVVELQEQIDGLPNETPLREEKILQQKRAKEELQRLKEPPLRRPVDPAAPPQPPPVAVPAPPAPRPVRMVENVEAVRAWLKENEPETHLRMVRAQDEGRRPEVMQILSEAEPRMRQMVEMKERDPKAFERTKEMRRLEGESVDLGERARRAAAPDERDRIAKQLSEVLQKLFDLREENRARDVAELKRRVEALEKELSNRKQNRERIVEQRRRELLGEKGEYDW
jgi:hypothetical protein